MMRSRSIWELSWCANHLNLPQREVPMRKIRHAKSRQVPSPEKKEPRFTSKNIWAIGIIAIMVFSAVGFYYADRQDLAPGYNGFRFKLGANNEYLLKWNKEQIPFTYHPTELEGLAIDANAMAMLNSPVLLLTFDPTIEPTAVEIVRYRIAQRLYEQRGVQLQFGVAVHNSSYPLPFADCDNATAALPVLEIAVRQPEGIQATENCVRLSAPSGSSLQALGERVEYSLLGVMP